MPTTTELLDFAVLSSRAESMHFDVLDSRLLKIGEANPFDVATVQNDTTRAVGRTLTSLHLTPSDTAAIDVRNELIRPSWKLSSGRLFPLGVFAFANPIRARHTWGVESTNTLNDLTVGIDVATGETVGFPTGLKVTDALAAYIGTILATPFHITGSEVRFGQPAVWPPGTSSYQIIGDLCKLLAYLSPYFDNDGHLICRPVPVIRAGTPAFTYEEDTTVEVDTISESSTLLSAPNRYIVIGGGFDSINPIVGVFDIPAGAPNSITNRGGLVVPKTISLQSVQDDVAAYAAARAAYANDKIVDNAEFDAVADPRHETFDVVRYHGTNYLEVGWTLQLTVGGTHHHVLRSVYD